MTLDFNDIAPLPDPTRRTLGDAEREEDRKSTRLNSSHRL